MNNNAQNGSFCNVTDNQMLLMDPGQDAFYHASNRTPTPKWLVLRKSCELIVLRVVRESIWGILQDRVYRQNNSK